MTRIPEENANDAELDEYRKTLDGAREWFMQVKAPATAANLLTVATTYWHDEMIGDESYEDEIRLVRDWLNEADR